MHICLPGTPITTSNYLATCMSLQQLLDAILLPKSSASRLCATECRRKTLPDRVQHMHGTAAEQQAQQRTPNTYSNYRWHNSQPHPCIEGASPHAHTAREQPPQAPLQATACSGDVFRSGSRSLRPALTAGSDVRVREGAERGGVVRLAAASCVVSGGCISGHLFSGHLCAHGVSLLPGALRDVAAAHLVVHACHVAHTPYGEQRPHRSACTALQSSLTSSLRPKANAEKAPA
jgi:hypothetical protein